MIGTRVDPVEDDEDVVEDDDDARAAIGSLGLRDGLHDQGRRCTTSQGGAAQGRRVRGFRTGRRRFEESRKTIAEINASG